MKHANWATGDKTLCFVCGKREHIDGSPLCHGCRRRLVQYLGGGSPVVEYRVVGRETIAVELDYPENSLLHAAHRLASDLGQHIKGIDYDKPTGKVDDGLPEAIDITRLACLQDLHDRVFGWEQIWRHELYRPTNDPYALTSACGFLSSWLEHAEERDPVLVADMHTDLSDVMSQAHSLSPWRAKVTREKIPCLNPECERHSVVRYGGDDWFTCQSCGWSFDEAIWAQWSEAYRRGA